MVENEQKGKEMLQMAKTHIKAIVVDQDGTVKDENNIIYKQSNVAKLLQRITRSGIYSAIITGSGVTALKSFISPSAPTYLGIGNGTALYKFNSKGRTEVYAHPLTLQEEKTIITIWFELCNRLGIAESQLQSKGLETFRKFMITDWTGYIPPTYVKQFKEFNGKCFTEPFKVTLVFPAWDELRQRQLVKRMQKMIDEKLGKNRFVAQRGDNTFLHITHALSIDPKLFALNTIMKMLSLKRKNIVVFGDLPLDNDRGMLAKSRFPYTFTNHEYRNKNPNKPPYILPGSTVSPIRSVYNAIDYLLMR